MKVRYGGTVFTLVLYTLCQSEGEVWWDSVHPCSLHSVKVKVRSTAGTLAPLVKQLWVFLENDPPMAQDPARK